MRSIVIRSLAPCKLLMSAIMRDLGRAMTEAAAQYVQSLEKPLPALAQVRHALVIQFFFRPELRIANAVPARGVFQLQRRDHRYRPCIQLNLFDF